MTSPFHPELRTAAKVMPRRGHNRWLIDLGRRLAPLQARQRVPAGIEAVSVGGVPVRLHRPPYGEAPFPALLWIHGGGHMIGSASQDDAICKAVARDVGAVVAAVDYRLSPEDPFPAALDDCNEALLWLAARVDVDPARIAVGGASAGGGMAAALAIRARDEGQVAPAFQLLSYPMLDDRTATRAVDGRHHRLWTNDMNHDGWSAYLGTSPGGADVSPLAAPARCEALAGLPPAWIGVGTCDLFHDEDREYARRLREAGVACELDVIEGAFHGFDSVVPWVGVSKDYHAAMVGALAEALRAPAGALPA